MLGLSLDLHTDLTRLILTVLEGINDFRTGILNIVMDGSLNK